MRATPDGMKVCSKCRLNREIAWFGKDHSRVDGLHYWCKECHRVRKAAYYRRNKATFRIQLTGTKTCTKCKETKDINCFGSCYVTKMVDRLPVYLVI